MQTSRLYATEVTLIQSVVLTLMRGHFRLRNKDDPKKDVAVAETHFLTHYRLIYLVCYRSYTHSKCCFKPNGWAWSLPVT